MLDIPTTTCSSSSAVITFPLGPRLIPSGSDGDMSRWLNFLGSNFPFVFHAWLAVSTKCGSLTTFAMLQAEDRLNCALVPLRYVARACCSQILIAYLIIKRGDDSTIIFDADILEICEVLAGELSSSNLSELVRRGTSEWITLLRIQCDRDTITGPRLQ